MAKVTKTTKAPAAKKLSKRTATDALTRIGELEQGNVRLVAGIQQAFQELTQQFTQPISQLTELVEALSSIVGKEKVNEAVDGIRKARVEESAESAKKALDSLVDQGVAVPTTAIGENSIVVGREYDKDGALLHPGRVQLQWSYIKPEFQEKLKGQGPGAKIEAGNGNTFEVVEAYDIVAPKAAEQTVETTTTN